MYKNGNVGSGLNNNYFGNRLFDNDDDCSSGNNDVTATSIMKMLEAVLIAITLALDQLFTRLLVKATRSSLPTHSLRSRQSGTICPKILHPVDNKLMRRIRRIHK